MVVSSRAFLTQWVSTRTTAQSKTARDRCPGATIIEADFFEWADTTEKRFAATVGNPPFIRYQRFAGQARDRALRYCEAQGVRLSRLCSSWAPFVVAALSVLKPGGRLAFVVPAEIAHAVYARPLLRFLLGSFDRVEVLAFRDKLFRHLSEDCWLLRADGYGGKASELTLTTAHRFDFPTVSSNSEAVSLQDLEDEGFRLRPFLLPERIRREYLRLGKSDSVSRFGAVAGLGIGYVTGANDFFHLCPSEAMELGIPDGFLRPAVRSSRELRGSDINNERLSIWTTEDRPFLLLNLPRKHVLPRAILRYLNTQEASYIRRRYKCRIRDPWYCVPDVRVPDAFLSIMSSDGPRLVGNSARCACTNSVHAVTLKNGFEVPNLIRKWKDPLTQLSCEVEGHHLGGGMLKVEPIEARSILIETSTAIPPPDNNLLEKGVEIMRSWRRRNGTRSM